MDEVVTLKTQLPVYPCQLSERKPALRGASPCKSESLRSRHSSSCGARTRISLLGPVSWRSCGLPLPPPVGPVRTPPKRHPISHVPSHGSLFGYVLRTTSPMESPVLIARRGCSVCTIWSSLGGLQALAGFPAGWRLACGCQVPRWTPLVHSAGPCAQDAASAQVPGGVAHVGLPVIPWRAGGHDSDSDETVRDCCHQGGAAPASPGREALWESDLWRRGEAAKPPGVIGGFCIQDSALWPEFRVPLWGQQEQEKDRTRTGRAL